MASFDIAFAWLMSSEDPQYKYEDVPDAPPGARAISGINSAQQPEGYATVARVPQAQRAPIVKGFYQNTFWNRYFDGLTSDELAKRVFDAAVNMGAGTAVRLLQTAIEHSSGLTDGIDGELGPQTVFRANACNPDMLAACFRQLRGDHYRAIAAAKPEESKYLNGWLARAER